MYNIQCHQYFFVESFSFLSAHGSTTPPEDDPEDTGTTDLEVNLDGVMIVAAPCATCLLLVANAVVGTKRKRGVRGTAGVLKRDIPAE